MWSSSKDDTNNPVKSVPISSESPSLGSATLRTASQHLDVKTECAEQDDQSCTPCNGKIDNSALPAFLDHAEVAGDKSKPIAKEQVLQVNSYQD